ncbi:MAG: T9SS type A sorting domain-containing protein [Bacteroidetes bacterium]|jgi:hypothetical protein|nr:T9SS type A sorting domain-containing protein [Bacteroidota bacterium]
MCELKTIKHCFISIAIILAFAFDGFGQVSITTGNTTYTEDFTGFDGNTDPANWLTEDVTDTSNWEGTGSGTSTAGGKYSFGTGIGATFEGSLGFLPSSNRAINAEISFINNTDSDIISFDISYVAEHWRSANGGRNNGWAVSYSIDGSSFTSISSLTYVAPNTVPTGGGPHGSESLSDTINVTIPIGSEITIRFFGDNGTGSGSRQGVAIDDFEITFNESPFDFDSKVVALNPNVASSIIISDETTLLTDSKPVLKFVVEDLGSGDGVATEISQISFVPGPANTADWSDVIQGIRVNAGGVNIAGTNQTIVALNDNEITYSFDYSAANVSNNMSVDDGTTKEFEIRVFLNTTNIIGGEAIQLEIEQNNTKFLTRSSGSVLENVFDTAITGNQHTISVPSRKLSFIQQPQTTIVNEDMNFDVEVAYVDNNGNVNNEETTAIEITSSGSMLGDPIIEIPVNGISSFTVNHDVLATNLQLTASTSISGISDLNSNNFSIIETVELFITEVVDPDELDGEGKYVEIFNAGINAIDFSLEDYFIVREANGGPSINNIQLSGKIEAKGYYTIGNENFNTKYGISADLIDSSFAGTIAGNGDDSYFLAISVTDGNEGRNSIVDLYGEIGVQPENESTSWFYENRRAYRDNPNVKNASNVWIEIEWTQTEIGDISVIEPTPGYGDQDYIYDGDWTNIGLGNPAGVSSGSENIFIRSGDVSFSSDITIGDLVVRSGARLTLEPQVILTVTGDIVNEGSIIFESDANGSAVLETVSDNTRVVGYGFEIHRYIPNSNRAFRYLAPSVSTNNSTQPTINDNWQEGVNNTSQLDADNQNPTPGFGTHITGSTTGANGFDATSTGNPSMFEWDVNTQAWSAIPNTDSKQFFTGEAYAILIRGDRATTLNSNTALGNPTTLRSFGRIHVGDFPLTETDGDLTGSDNANGSFNLIGNPYQSQVNLKDLLDNHANEINNNVAYIYDPTLGDIGGYATIDLESLSFTSVPTGTSANQFLQPNQAFFVESIGTSPSVTFTESVKNNVNNQVGTFSDSQNTLPTHININLRDNNNQLVDGVRIVYDNSYSSIINQNDAKKAWNFNESITVYSKDTHLSIEKRNLPSAIDTSQIQIFNYTKNEYSLNLDFKTNAQTNVEAYLHDQYTQNLIEILPNQITDYDFLVDQNIPETTSPQRFQIIYDETTLGIDDFDTEFNLYPNPMTSNTLYIDGILKNIEGIERVELFSIQGQKIIDFRGDDIDKAGHRVSLKFKRKVNQGYYLLHITTLEKGYIRKLIIN